jgi:hypothetical protein
MTVCSSVADTGTQVFRIGSPITGRVRKWGATRATDVGA